jgi:serine/threonine protein phosphatase PrpC
MTVNAGAYSSRGSIREHNEDSFLVGNEIGGGGIDDSFASFNSSIKNCLIFTVADGMGGHEAGDMASGFVVRHILKAVQDYTVIAPAIMEIIIKETHRQLLDEGVRNNTPNMGSTLAGIIIQPDTAGFFNIGDSRVYRLRNGFLQQLSRDDSLSGIVPGAAKNIITNAMGAGLPEVTVAIRFSPNLAVPNDIFFLCSDGVHGFITDDDLETLLAEQFSPVELVRSIVELAIENKSDDNCTALVVRIGE